MAHNKLFALINSLTGEMDFGAEDTIAKKSCDDEFAVLFRCILELASKGKTDSEQDNPVQISYPVAFRAQKMGFVLRNVGPVTKEGGLFHVFWKSFLIPPKKDAVKPTPTSIENDNDQN
jgi:hypothetical protein